MKTIRRSLGDLGEELASRFLNRKGIKIVERNYLRPFGEIDLIGKSKRGTIHFIEVKAVTREIGNDVSRVTPGYAPEANIHHKKLERLKKTAQAYLLEKGIGTDSEWQIDSVGVFIDSGSNKAYFRHTENINVF